MQSENSSSVIARAKRGIKALKRFILAIVTCSILACHFFAALSQWVSPSDFMPFAYFGLVYPLIVVGSIVWFVVLCIIGSWRQILLMAPMVFAYKMIGATFPLYPPHSIAFVPNEQRVRVLTYNVCAFDYEPDSSIVGIQRLIDVWQPDIIFFQEFSLRAEGGQKFTKKLRQTYKYSSKNDEELKSKYDVLTLSKFPIVKSGIISQGIGNNRVVYADIVLPNGDTICAVNCHLASNHLNEREKQTINSISHGEKVEDMEETARYFNHKFLDSYTQRQQMADDARSYLRKCRYPLIVAGDFNDVPISYAYHRIKGHKLSSAVTDGGWGYNFTYRVPPFIVNIDHILYGEKYFALLNYERIKCNYSDHYPSLATFRVKMAGEEE